MLAALSLATAAPAYAEGNEPRFGDSTWVAPNVPPAGNPTEDGPRVAKPDHERTWETVLRTPFRVAFLPFRLLARGIEGGANFAETHFPLQDLGKPKGPPTSVSVSPEFAFAGNEGFGAGAAVKGPLFNPHNQFKGDALWTMNDNRRVRLRTLFGQGSLLGVGAEGVYDYRPNRSFYGMGNDAGTRRTIFLERENRADGWVSFGSDSTRRLRAIVGLSDVDIAPGYISRPRAVDVFSPSQVPFLTQGSRVKSYGLGGQFAALQKGGEPYAGMRLIGEARHVSSMGGGTNLRYESWRTEARGYVPVFSTRRVIALRGVYQGVDPDAGTDPIPFYRLPVSVKQNRFDAYSGERFRDKRLLLLQAEYRWLIWSSRLWAFALAQRGEVAPSTAAIRYAGMHESYGGGLRFHLSDAHAARLEVAKGSGGVNIDLELDTWF